MTIKIKCTFSHGHSSTKKTVSLLLVCTNNALALGSHCLTLLVRLISNDKSAYLLAVEDNKIITTLHNIMYSISLVHHYICERSIL